MDLLQKTQHWWAVTTRSSFLRGSALLVSDSHKPEDWWLLYRWHAVKQASAPLIMAGAGLALVALVVLLPSASIAWAPLLKPAVAMVAALVLAAGVWSMWFARNRKPFSVIALPVEVPHVVADQLEDLWIDLDDGEQDRLRREFIQLFESRPNWSPRALQQGLVTLAERERARVHGAPELPPRG